MPPNPTPAPARASALSRLGDPIVLLLTVGFIVAFIGLSLYDIDLVADSISAGFAWFIGYPPLMAIFVARISRGRTIREMILAMALMAGILLYMGAGQIGALQQFIVITAIPVSLVLLPSLWAGPRAAYAMAREQGIVAPLARPIPLG